MNWIRRGLLATPSEQTIAVIRILADHRGCERKVVETLLKTSPIQTHVAKHMPEITRLVARLPLEAV